MALSAAQEDIILYAATLAIVGGGIAGGVYSITNYIPSQIVAERIEQIDNSTSHIFNMTSCVRETNSPHTCQESWDAAVNDFWMKQNRLRYSNQGACLNNHPECTHVRRFNGKFYTNHYYPNIIGWEALADDLNVSIPIYESKYPQRGLRYDRKSLSYTARP